MIGGLQIARLSFVAAVLAASGDDASTRIAAEIDRWTAFQRQLPASDDLLQQVKSGSEAALARAKSALGRGEPWLALQRLAGPQTNLGAAEYLTGRPAAERGDLAAFEAEWTWTKRELGDVLGAASPGLDDVRPAALRALGEIAWTQARAFHAASRDYAASTEPKFGLFYVGQAAAARDFVALCRELSVATAATPSQPSSLGPLADEISALERELLEAYRPPRALLLHSEFISASSLLNEARELDEQGLRAGALLRMLQAALSSASLRKRPEASATAPELEPEPLAARLRALGERLASAPVDVSIARIFLASAQEAASESPPNEPLAKSIVDDVLPRCFRAIEPAAQSTAAPPLLEAQATLTLVRWPFT